MWPDRISAAVGVVDFAAQPLGVDGSACTRSGDVNVAPSLGSTGLCMTKQLTLAAESDRAHSLRLFEPIGVQR